MKNFYVVRGFRNTQVIMISDADRLRRWGDTDDNRHLMARYRDEDYTAAKGMMPCLIVGERKPGGQLYRSDENFIHTTHLLLDHDQPCDAHALAAHAAQVLDAQDLLHRSYIERSISGKLHMLVPRLTSDVHSDICTYEQLMGIEFDKKVTNTSRLMVLTFEALQGTTLENLIDVDDENEDEDVNGNENGNGNGHPDGNNCQLSIVNCQLGESYPELYHGLSYVAIVDALIEELGGMPQVGERNQFLYKCAAELRAITDSSVEWIASLLKEYAYFGLPEDEALSTIRSACRKSTQPRVGTVLKAAIGAALAQQGTAATVALSGQTTVAIPAGDEHQASVHQSPDEIEEHEEQTGETAMTESLSSGGVGEATTFSPFADTPPAIPDKLPAFCQLLIKNTPLQCRAHVFNGVEPALATYLVETIAVGIDGLTLHLGSGWLTAGIAKMSTGKSSRNEPLKAIKLRLKERDTEARRQMEEWNELARCTKSSDLPPRPTMQSQLLGADCTSSALLMRLKQLEQGALEIDVDELLQLLGLQTNSGESHTALLLAFNQEELTVDRSSEVGVSGSVTVRLNVSAQGTPYQAAQFFKNGWHTGLISRFSISTIIEPELMDDDDFLYGSYKGFSEKIAPYIDRLEAVSGKELCFKRADEHARRMRRETLQLAAEYGSEPLRVLCRRQSIIAQKRAYLYCLLEGGKWSQRLEDFLTWRYRYGLWAMFYILGGIIAEEQAAEDGVMTPKTKQDGPTNWLMTLPQTFTLQQLTDLRKLKGTTTDKKAVAKQLSNWRSRQLITDDPEHPGTYINLKKSI